MSLATNVSNLATRIATEIKALRTLINGNAADLSALTTTSKTNLVAAVNEVKNLADQAAGGGVQINDAATNTTQTWSSQKITDEKPTWSTISGKPAVIGAGATAADARTAIGAGTSNLAIGTGAGTAAEGNRTASTTTTGMVELATNAETTTGTDTVRATTPAGVKAVADTKADIVHTHTASQVSDSTATGRALLTAVDAAAARTAIGAGTSDLAIGTTGTTAAAGNRQATDTAIGMVELATTAEATTGTDTQRAVTPAGLKTVADTKAPLTHSHAAADISDSTATGRSVLTAATQAAARTAIGAGTSSLTIGTGAGTAAEGNRVATETTTGMVELATTTEATTGTDTSRAVTPAGLKAVADTKAALSHSHTAANITDFTSAVDARVQLVVDAAPAALDTLNELAAALGDDPNFAGTVTTALGLRVRVDAAQAFDATQQAQGRSNIGAASAADVGDTTTNFVTVFEAGLV